MEYAGCNMWQCGNGWATRQQFSFTFFFFFRATAVCLFVLLLFRNFCLFLIFFNEEYFLTIWWWFLFRSMDPFFEQLSFGRHHFDGVVELPLNSLVGVATSEEEDINTNNVFESPIITSHCEPFTTFSTTNGDQEQQQPITLPITFQLQVHPWGVDHRRRDFLSVVLVSRLDDDCLPEFSLRSQIGAVVWIESATNSREKEEEEPAVLLVTKKSITLPIEQLVEVARIRETFSTLVKRDELLAKCCSLNLEEEEAQEVNYSTKIRIRCKITLEPNFGSASELRRLFASRKRTFDLQLNFLCFSGSRRGGSRNPTYHHHVHRRNGRSFRWRRSVKLTHQQQQQPQQQENFLRAHQWQLMRSPGWRRHLFTHHHHRLTENVSNAKQSSGQRGLSPLPPLSIPAPRGLRLEAVKELLRFYYGLQCSSREAVERSIFRQGPAGFRHFSALVDVAIFSEDRLFMARIFSDLLGSVDRAYFSSSFLKDEDDDDGNGNDNLLHLPTTIRANLLPTALAYRRLAQRHNVVPVVARFDLLIERIFEQMRRQIVQASELVPLKAILLPPYQWRPSYYQAYQQQQQQPPPPAEEGEEEEDEDDPVLNQLLYALFGQAAVKLSFLSSFPHHH